MVDKKQNEKLLGIDLEAYKAFGFNLFGEDGNNAEGSDDEFPNDEEALRIAVAVIENVLSNLPNGTTVKQLKETHGTMLFFHSREYTREQIQLDDRKITIFKCCSAMEIFDKCEKIARDVLHQEASVRPISDELLMQTFKRALRNWKGAMMLKLHNIMHEETLKQPHKGNGKI